MNTKEIIEDQVLQTISLTNDLEQVKSELEKNPTFKKFLELQKTVNEKAAETWKTVEAQMIANDTKKIEGEWGSLTIAERLDFDVDLEALPPRYKKTVANTTKIRTVYLLDKKPITGATPKYKKYLTKRIKLGSSDDN